MTLNLEEDEAWVALQSGGRYYFKTPAKSTFTIDDIAISLSMENRFSNQAGWYSVAEHSCHVCDFAEKEDPGTELEHLLHDAPEFVFKDMATPLKILIPEYSVLEKKGHHHIVTYYGGLPGVSYKDIDTLLVVNEARRLLGDNCKWLNQDKYKDVRILTEQEFSVKRWSPVEAMYEFMKRFKKYVRKNG
jgi:hypothetical protein